MIPALIIFTRNERKNSEKIFLKLTKDLINKIYVVDGNSTDGTKEFWQSKKIKVFGQKYPGVGGAYESAFSNTKEDALIFFHPDGNMNPKDIKNFVEILKSGADFVVASRMIKGGVNEEDNQFYKPRKWFCRLLGMTANIIWGRNNNSCSDITQGYRAFSRIGWMKLKIKIPNAIAPDFEQVIRALKYDVKIIEFPTIEGKRVFGETSMRSLKTGWENIKVFLKEF